MLDRVDAEASEQILTEDDRDSAERGGANQNELRPAEEKGGAPAPPLAQIRVKAAGFRQRRRKLGQRQGAARA